MIMPYRAVRRLGLLGVALALVLLQGSTLLSIFTLLSVTSVNPPPSGVGIHGIARVGNQWFMANFNSGWNIYDMNFNQVGTTTTTSPTGETRGLVYNSNSGNLFIGDISTSTIYEVTTGGVVVNSFSSSGLGLNALAFNPTNNDLFALHFNGLVEELTTAGAVVGSFVASGLWTGAAYDAINNTVLLLNSGLDQVFEYTTTGTLLNTPISGDAVSGNGQGLHYDLNTGNLHVTSQGGNIAIWTREAPVAVHQTTWGAIKAKYGP